MQRKIVNILHNGHIDADIDVLLSSLVHMVQGQAKLATKSHTMESAYILRGWNPLVRLILWTMSIQFFLKNKAVK